MARLSVGLKLCTNIIVSGQFQRIIRPLAHSELAYLSSNRHYSSKDVIPRYSVYQPAEGREPPDYLLIDIRSSPDVTRVLEILRSHSSIMNSKHVMQTLRSILELQKSGCSSLTKSEVISTPEFLRLCRILKSQCRSLDVSDTLDALKTMAFFDVPSNSEIIFCLLQIIRHKVNELSLQQITFLDFVIKRFERTPLVNALHIALPFVFEAQVKLKLDKTNILHLTDSLVYSSFKKLPSSTEFLLEEIDRIKNDVNMNSKAAKDIILTFCNMREFPTKYEELFLLSLDALAYDIRTVSLHDLEYTLNRLCVRYGQSKWRQCYHENFLNSCVSRIISENHDFSVGSRFLRRLIRMHHVNIDLLDYLSAKVVRDHYVLKDTHIENVTHYIHGLSDANYKPENWLSVQEAILDSGIVESHDPEIPWIQVAMHLVSLGCFSTKLIERVFSEDYLSVYESSGRRLDMLQMLLLYQAVFSLYPIYSGPFPSNDLLEKAIGCVENEEMYKFPLKSALEKGIGGASYLLTGVYTKLGHFIDHVVFLRQGGYPVAIEQSDIAKSDQSSKNFIEDVFLSENTQPILIFCRDSDCYANNCLRLRGHFSLEEKTLEALGYLVLSIPYEAWWDMPDSEKIPYLMHRIKECYESSLTSHSNVL